MEKPFAVVRVAGRSIRVAGSGEIVIAKGPVGGKRRMVLPDLEKEIEGGFRAGKGEIAGAMHEIAADTG